MYHEGITHNSNTLHATTLVTRRILQHKCACGQHTPGGSKCTECRDKEKINQSLQAKLQVGETNDKYEQEADRAAEQVMRMSQPTNSDEYGLWLPSGQPSNSKTRCQYSWW